MSSGIASDSAPPSRAPQRQRGRDRVAGLMQAAATLFVERGYDATTMTEIASRAGAAIGSLYLFFPTKPALANAIASALADGLSARLDALQTRSAGSRPEVIADALFDELSAFLAEHPVYAVLVDVSVADDWRDAVRARRRTQIAALFAQADPPLPTGQPDRLAVIVPHLIRIATVSSADSRLRDGILREVRAMLRNHLAQSVKTSVE